MIRLEVVLQTDLELERRCNFRSAPVQAAICQSNRSKCRRGRLPRSPSRTERRCGAFIRGYGVFEILFVRQIEHFEHERDRMILVDVESLRYARIDDEEIRLPERIAD